MAKESTNGVKIVHIRFNFFEYEPVQITDEDTQGGIVERYELFQSVKRDTLLVGNLIKFSDGRFRVSHGPHRNFNIHYDFPAEDVIFLTK